MSRVITVRVSDPLYSELLQVVDSERQRTGYPVTINSYVQKVLRNHFKEAKPAESNKQPSEMTLESTK